MFLALLDIDSLQLTLELNPLVQTRIITLHRREVTRITLLLRKVIQIILHHLEVTQILELLHLEDLATLLLQGQRIRIQEAIAHHQGQILQVEVTKVRHLEALELVEHQEVLAHHLVHLEEEDNE